MSNPAGRPPKPASDRFAASYSVSDDGCWVWKNKLNHDGYGRFKTGGEDSRNINAHRWSYENSVGPIPDGLVLDHLCRNRACVNPAHLEPVTNKENVLRGVSVMVDRANSTTCVHGHPLSGENLYLDANGNRACKVCRRAAGRRHRERNIESERARCREYSRAHKDELTAKRRVSRAIARADE